MGKSAAQNVMNKMDSCSLEPNAVPFTIKSIPTEKEAVPNVLPLYLGAHLAKWGLMG